MSTVLIHIVKSQHTLWKHFLAVLVNHSVDLVSDVFGAIFEDESPISKNCWCSGLNEHCISFLKTMARMQEKRIAIF